MRPPVDAIAAELFGDDAFARPPYMKPAVVTFVDGLITLTWNRWRAAFTRDLKKLEQEQRELENAEQGKCRIQLLDSCKADHDPPELEAGNTTPSALWRYLKAMSAILTRLARWKEVKGEEWQRVNDRMAEMQEGFTAGLVSE